MRETWDTLKDIQIQKEKEIKNKEEVKNNDSQVNLVVSKLISKENEEKDNEILKKVKPKPKHPFSNNKQIPNSKADKDLSFDGFKVKIPKENIKDQLEVPSGKGKSII